MGRTKGSKNKVKTTTVKTTTKKENENIQNPGLKPAPVEKLITDKNNKINNNSLALSLNKSNLPNSITESEKEWARFSKLVKDNTRARLENIACSTIKWTELEEGMDARVIEYGFLINGWVTAFNDPEYGPLALKSLPNFFNVNSNPTYASVYGFQGYMKQVHCIYKGKKELKPIVNVDELMKSDIDGVICRDNNYGKENFPKRYIDYVKEYTEILSNLKLGMLISAERLKQPFILAIKKRALGKSSNALINAIRNNKSSVVLIDEGLITKEGTPLSVKDYIEFIDLKGDSESPKKLQELWENQFNNFLTLFGINNNPTPDKSQYVNITENNTNNELLRIEADVRFKNREQWCKDCKDLLGFNMKCELNQDSDDLKNMINQMKGELGNGIQERPTENQKNPE